MKLILKIILIFSFIGITTSFNEKQSVTVEIYHLNKKKNLKKIKNTDFEYRLIYGHNYSSEINATFLQKLKKAGYKKSKFSDEKSIKIIEFLDSKKEGYSKYETACKKMYRDVIVIKKENEIIKIIKICTSCYANQVLYKKNETELLLSFEDYDNLSEQFKN